MIYEFICKACCNNRLADYAKHSNTPKLEYDDSIPMSVVEDLELNDFRFDHMTTMAEYDETNVSCPNCGSKNTKRLISSVGFVMGMTAAQRSSGTTSKRLDMANYMRDQRDKRKRQYAPGTKQHDSNELWTGNEIKDGVLKKSDMNQQVYQSKMQKH